MTHQTWKFRKAIRPLFADPVTNIINLHFNENHHTLMTGVEVIITAWMLAQSIQPEIQPLLGTHVI